MQILNEMTANPGLFHDLCQNQKWYIGNDEITEKEYPKGTIIVALAGPSPKTVGYYFIDPKELIDHNFNSNSLCQGVQVCPYNDPSVVITPEYKTDARFYVINEPLKAAVGEVTDNSHYGSGELVQYAIPNSREMILDALDDPNRFNPNHTIIPVDLNNFDSDLRLATETKEKLDFFKAKALQAGCILSGDGSIKLKDREVSHRAYLSIKLREKIHELTVKCNCLSKEYIDELQKNPSDRDIVKIKAIRDELKRELVYCEKKEAQLLKNGKHLLDNPDLMKGFNGKNREHLLDMNTCIPKRTQEIAQYLDKRITYLESKLNISEMKSLGIDPETLKSTNEKSNEPLNHENPQDEAKVQEMYKKYAVITPDNYPPRKLVFAPKEHIERVTRAKQELLCQFKSKEDLQQFLQKLKVRKTKNKTYTHCEKQIKVLEQQIEKTSAELKLFNDTLPKSTTEYDESLEYLKQKNEQIEKGASPQSDSKKELKIDKLYQEALDDFVNQVKNSSRAIKSEMIGIKTAFESKEFCDLYDSLDEQKTILSKVIKIDAEKKSLNKKIKELVDVRLDLETINRYQPDLIEKKHSHEEEKDYKQAKERLEKSGITNMEQFNEAKAELKGNIEHFQKKYAKIKDSLLDKDNVINNIGTLSKKMDKIMQEYNADKRKDSEISI